MFFEILRFFFIEHDTIKVVSYVGGIYYLLLTYMVDLIGAREVIGYPIANVRDSNLLIPNSSSNHAT